MVPDYAVILAFALWSHLSTGFHKTVTFLEKGDYDLLMLIRFALTISICFAFPTLANASMNDLNCDDSARMTDMLTEALGAERQGMGLRDPETFLEIWVTQRNGDWIIVQNYTNGTSCIVAIGEHWEGVIPEPA